MKKPRAFTAVPEQDREFGVEQPFYDRIPRGKFKPERAAIDNLDELRRNRPLKPPSKQRTPLLPCSRCGTNCDDCGGSYQ